MKQPLYISAKNDQYVKQNIDQQSSPLSKSVFEDFSCCAPAEITTNVLVLTVY